MYQFKLDKIKLKNGLEYIPNKINIIIGPNNAGKSKFLKEIAEHLSQINKDKCIVGEIEFKYPNSFEELNETYKIEDKLTLPDSHGNIYLKVYNNFKGNNQYPQYKGKEYLQRGINEKVKDYFLNYGALFFSYLGTENRLTMLNETMISTSFMEYNVSFISDIINNLESKGPITEQLSILSKKMFFKDVLFDYFSESGKVSFKVENDLTEYKDIKVTDYNKIVELRNKSLLDSEGDGLKSFATTYLSLKCENRNILLIDEPEAFLHPPLARQLGEIIGESATEEKQIFIATHSSEILKGIISKTDDVNIIRITREEDSNTITKLEKENLEKIMKTPRLRVSKILEGLFCEKVIITEAETDEIFYQEFLEKVYPYSGVFFTHVNGKGNIVETSNLYKTLGVENVMIFDFDFVRNDSKSLFNNLRDLKLGKEKINEYLQISRDVEQYITDKAKNNIDIDEDDKKYNDKLNVEKKRLYHVEGINCLEKKLKVQVDIMLNELEEKNVFVLRTGELESTLQNFGIEYTKTNKDGWIEKAIEFIDGLTEEKINQYKNEEIIKFIFKLKNDKAKK